MRLPVPALLLALLALLATALPAQTAAPNPVAEVVANGSGVVRLRPDRATVAIAVVTRARTAPEAARANATRMTGVLTALRRAGVPDSAVTTSGFAVSREDRGYGVPQPADAEPVHVARNAVSVATSDLGAIAGLLDAALDAGATEVTGIRYGSSRASEARRDAIALAVRDARAQAEAAATAAGGSLGALRSLTVNPGYGGGEFSGMAASLSTTRLLPADVVESAQVIVRFVFLPAR